LHKTEEDRIMKEQEIVTKNTWARLARIRLGFSDSFYIHVFQFFEVIGALILVKKIQGEAWVMESAL